MAGEYKIKFLKKPGYYNGTYPEGAVALVDKNFGDYVVGMGDAERVPDSTPVTDPTPYEMAPRKTSAEESLAVIADALRPRAPGGKEA